MYKIEIDFFQSKYFRRFFRRNGAQNRGVLDVHEDSNTGSTTKIPKRQCFERSIIKILCVLSVLFISITLCFVKNKELNELAYKKQEILIEKNKFNNLYKQISEYNFRVSDNLFGEISNLKNVIKNIAQKSHVKNILLKRHNIKHQYFNIENIELKFSAELEHYIYDFIDNFRKNLSELIIFDAVKLKKKSKHNFIAKIQCRIFSLKKYIDNRLFPIISPVYEDTICAKSIRIFAADERPKKYILHCVLNNAKAFINDTWISAGESLDEFYIKNVYQNSIDIQSDEKVSNIKLGEIW